MVSYNGNTLYVASNLLTSTKPEDQVQEEPTEEKTAEEKPKEEPTVTIEQPEKEDDSLMRRAFKCTNIGYDSYGRVNSIKFEEKQWGDLY